MPVLEKVVAGTGLVLLGTSFLRLARTDATERVHLLALEYGVSLSLVVAGVGLIAIATVSTALG